VPDARREVQTAVVGRASSSSGAGFYHANIPSTALPREGTSRGETSTVEQQEREREVLGKQRKNARRK
jgi:hypothetical protein